MDKRTVVMRTGNMEREIEISVSDGFPDTDLLEAKEEWGEELGVSPRDIEAFCDNWWNQEDDMEKEDWEDFEDHNSTPEILAAWQRAKEEKRAERISDAAAVMGRKGGSSKSEAKQAAVRENGRKGGRPEHRFFVVPAPGYYGDTAQVRSSHATLEAAKKATGNSGCVRKGNKKRGDKWLRVYEETYPRVD